MKIHDLIFQLRQVAANNAGNTDLTYLLLKAAEKLADQKLLIESIELNEKLALAAADDARNDYEKENGALRDVINKSYDILSALGDRIDREVAEVPGFVTTGICDALDVLQEATNDD